jgi:hypothetical protein
VFLVHRCTYVEIPTELSLEIDSPLDLACAESIMAKKCCNNQKIGE